MTLMSHPWLAARPLVERAAITVFLALLGSLILAVSARIQVPFWPVPMTMQTLAVLTLAMMLGARLGCGIVLLYIAEGMLGLPVFANTPERGIGLAYLLGPTGGYLLGFALAAWLVGWLVERGHANGITHAVLVQAFGTLVILICGWAWLGMLVGPAKAFAVGVTPFLLSSLVKIVLGGLLVAAVRRRLVQA